MSFTIGTTLLASAQIYYGRVPIILDQYNAYVMLVKPRIMYGTLVQEFALNARGLFSSFT